MLMSLGVVFEVVSGLKVFRGMSFLFLEKSGSMILWSRLSLVSSSVSDLIVIPPTRPSSRSSTMRRSPVNVSWTSSALPSMFLIVNENHDDGSFSARALAGSPARTY
jgi:hypothetical protein